MSAAEDVVPFLPAGGSPLETHLKMFSAVGAFPVVVAGLPWLPFRSCSHGARRRRSHANKEQSSRTLLAKSAKTVNSANYKTLI